MSIPTDLRYTRDHEWVRREQDGTLTVGITHYAQKQLGDVVFVEVHLVGRDVEEQEGFGTIESVKAVSELFVPVSGKLTEANPAIADDPELVNTDPYGEGWIIKLTPSDAKAYDGLMTAKAYEDHLATADD
jgi:glycine cleavage system H protein